MSGDTERRVALYDMESGSYKDNPDVLYNWEGTLSSKNASETDVLKKFFLNS